MASCHAVTRVQVEVRSDPGLAARCRRWGARWGLDVEVVDDARPGVPVVRPLQGRGRREGYRWALHHHAWEAVWPPEVVPYGPSPDHVGDLRLPGGPGPHPLAVLLHGGFWLDAWRRDTLDGLAVDLARHGLATWNVEYRRTSWPAPSEDVAAALRHVSTLAGSRPVEPGRVTLLGHSAGAQLALCAAASAPTAVALVVGLAPVTDLEAAAAAGLGGGAAERFLPRGPARAAAIAEASPMQRVPIGVRTVLAHARDDDIVPAEQSRAYAEAARRAGDDVELLDPGEGGHFALIDPATDAWAAVAARLAP
jgi:acetyl esterase/lipase